MNDPNNPVNRLCRALGIKAAALAEAVQVTPRHFQTLSASNPQELMKIIQEKTPFTWSQKNPPMDGKKLGGKGKTEFADMYLYGGSKKTAGTLEGQDAIDIHKVANASDGPHYHIDDMVPGTPVTATGNLVLPEFAQLLELRQEWHDFVKTISRDSGVACDLAWKKCKEKYNGQFTPEQWAQACAAEIKDLTDEAYKKVMRVLVPISEYFAIKALFRKLYRHVHRQQTLTEAEKSKLDQYRTWFSANYSIPTEQFKYAIQEGRLALVEKGAEERLQKGHRYPLPENLRAGFLQRRTDPPQFA